MSKFLLEAVSSDVNGDTKGVNGGNTPIAVWADNFGGGTVTIEGSPDGGTTWIILTKSDGSLAQYTANEIDLIDRLAAGMKIRANLTGSSGAVNVNAKVFD